MEIKGEYAAAVLIADRSDLRPLHQPRSWLHGATSSPLFMMLSVWPWNKRAAARSVIREDWNQLLTLTIQHIAMRLAVLKYGSCNIKYIGGEQYYMILVLTAPAASVPLKHPLSNIPLCYWSKVKATDNDASWSYRETMKNQMFMAGLRQPFKRRQVTITNIICSTLKPNSSLEYRKEPSNRLRPTAPTHIWPSKSNFLTSVSAPCLAHVRCIC